ncbi:uncharacterized protein LOC108732256 isoform X2 [Agrilus planipennis]|uniref:Uncharacterized protein LOC108732256 isoform X1 n=1 Tax=Agrilus planipennis TaxID=224129 RepID=A0A1W4WEM2_AGRPL|nr:uncharacterized protein LOC108732256 isoform X1 [Agrilus planipennis]XP_018318450.1 uncharacterized protein LOC108732256 isoform X2 [Agrilus planipennis]
MPKLIRKRRASVRSDSSDKSASRKLIKLIENIDQRLKVMEKKGRSMYRRPLSSSPSASSSSGSSRSLSRDSQVSSSDEERHQRGDREPQATSKKPDVITVDEGSGRQEEQQTSADLPLSEDILEIMGKVNPDSLAWGPIFHKDVIVRWRGIMASGLSEDCLQELFTKYPPPENFRILTAPLLNPQVERVLSESHRLRDVKLQNLQRQLSTSLTTNGQLLNLILTEEGEGATENTFNYCMMQED